MVLRNYNLETQGVNKAVLVPVTGKCRMACSWCSVDKSKFEERSAEYYSRELIDLKKQGYTILLSGGEPTDREDFITLVSELHGLGWPVVTMSNMLAFADGNFMKTCGLIHHASKTLLADFSMQHPKNYSEEAYEEKKKALGNLDNLGLKANCMQFSVSSLDELEWIRTFYNETHHLYRNLRIRTLYGFWEDTSEKIYLSQLYKAFVDVFGDLIPGPDNRLESTNIYSIYMRDPYCGLSLSSSPTIQNVDLLSCRRPTYAVALDGKYYSFPVAQLVSEGIAKGWYNGYKI
jgi:organic radical activating enzyme